MEKETFILETNGIEEEYEVLFQFFSPEYQRHYLVYTNGLKDEEDNLNVYISSYNPTDENFELYDITNEQELERIADYIDEIWSDDYA